MSTDSARSSRGWVTELEIGDPAAAARETLDQREQEGIAQREQEEIAQFKEEVAKAERDEAPMLSFTDPDDMYRHFGITRDGAECPG